ncbi:MAG TPA: HNH endonuclease [Patescibacteria group bacterium]|nr:HNH endonuclease [Patescibacteria group bacterium]
MKLCWDNINKLSYDITTGLWLNTIFYARKGRKSLQKIVHKYTFIDKCCWCGDSFLGLLHNKNMYCSKSCGVSAKQTGKPSPLLGTKKSQEATEKTRKGNLGKVRSAHMLKRYSLSKLGSKNPMYGRTGNAHPAYGKKIDTSAMNEGLRNYLKANRLPYNHTGHPLKGVKRPNFSGENAPGWKGGVSTINETVRKSMEYRQWRSEVFINNNYTCQNCDKKGGRLVAHHIIPFNYIMDNNLTSILYDVNNGVTLCKTCHKDIHKLIGFKV